MQHDEGNSLTSNPRLREVYLVGMVDDDMARHAIPAIRSMDRREGPIHVVLASTGGEVDAGWAIYDTLRLARNTIVTEAYGTCQSAAALLLQGGNIRLLAPDCRFMIHQGSVGVGGTVQEVSQLIKEVNYLVMRYYEVLAERGACAGDIEAVRKLCREETYVSATQALSLGFCDGTITKPPKKGRNAKR